MDSVFEFFQTIFDWYALMDLGVDASAYFVMAVVGSLLFLLKFALTLFAGIDADYDIGIDTDLDFNADAGSFSMFSTLSIVSFIMGAGWMGLISRVAWERGSITAGFLSAGFGFVLMFVSAFMLFSMQKLNETPVEDRKSAVGSTGQVYMSIPAKGEGAGQVQLSVSGRQRTLPAVSTGESLAAWDAVKIVEVRDDGVMVVEKLA